MGRVFVTQESSYNFSKAEKFGEIVFISRDDLHNTQASLHNEQVMQEINRKLKNFDENEDWLVIAGSPYIAAVVFLNLGKRGVKNLNLLRWDNRDYMYLPMKLNLRGAIDNERGI